MSPSFPFPPITKPCGEKLHREGGGESVEHRLLAVEIIDEGKLHFSSEVSLTPWTRVEGIICNITTSSRFSPTAHLSLRSCRTEGKTRRGKGKVPGAKLPAPGGQVPFQTFLFSSHSVLLIQSHVMKKGPESHHFTMRKREQEKSVSKAD